MAALAYEKQQDIEVSGRKPKPLPVAKKLAILYIDKEVIKGITGRLHPCLAHRSDFLTTFSRAAHFSHRHSR
jgi:hypothetical protein